QPLRFLDIKGELRDKIIAKYPFFAPAVIEKGTYSGLGHDVETIAVQACLVARRDMSDDEAYAITKAIFTHLEDLGNAHAKGKSLTLEHALDGMTLDIHPGALKYYKEVGLVK
ncbi:MAG: TAXI family TRAP transporter solute-binding subunit, partial [Pyramidobacter sp.]|nr:TAXI family TRAP transporter solute-binding subunit [Pyramidobacter sp.]